MDSKSAPARAIEDESLIALRGALDRIASGLEAIVVKVMSEETKVARMAAALLAGKLVGSYDRMMERWVQSAEAEKWGATSEAGQAMLEDRRKELQTRLMGAANVMGEQKKIPKELSKDRLDLQARALESLEAEARSPGGSVLEEQIKAERVETFARWEASQLDQSVKQRSKKATSLGRAPRM